MLSRCAHTQAGGGGGRGGHLVHRALVGVDGDQLGAEERVHLATVERGHPERFSQGVVFHQGQLDVALVEDQVLLGQDVGGEKPGDLKGDVMRIKQQLTLGPTSS